MELLAWLEAQPLFAALRASRHAYPLVNAGHILGLALLVGAVIPMDLRLIRGDLAGAAGLRPHAAAGLVLAIACGALLFGVRGTEYAANPWFRWKMALLALALANAALHLRIAGMAPARQRLAAALSLLLWPAILLSGRMIAYV